MPSDAAEENAVVFRQSETVLLSSRVSGAWICERKDPHKKAEDGRLYGVKTMKLVDENAAQDVFRKKEEQREKRRENRIRKVHQ